MQKKLSEILTKVSFSNYTLLNSPTKNDPIITALEFDSRKITKNSLYFSLPGTHVHGNQFIAQAIQKGAKAIVFQDDLENQKEELISLLNTIPEAERPIFIKVPSSRYAMAPISDAFYDYPSTKLGIIGVTGTEGKSTTVYLIWQFLQLLSKKAGFISTVQYSLGDEALDNSEHQTTPEAPIINQRLFSMIENNCEFAVIESSSHGLSEKTNRLGTIAFDAGAMMNVTHEHLEFHGTHEQYKYDKANLFRALLNPTMVEKDNVDFKKLSIELIKNANGNYYSYDALSSIARKRIMEITNTNSEKIIELITEQELLQMCRKCKPDITKEMLESLNIK